MPEEIKKEEEYLNGWKRAKADLINYQKDEVKRFEEMVKFANGAIIKDLIAVLDSFDLATTILEKGGGEIKGVFMIKSQLEDVMKKNGVEELTVSVGAAFDTNLHESVGEVESDVPSGLIAEKVARGYSLNGRVIRPAKVKLSKSK